MPNESKFYILDARTGCGDCAVWWAPKSQGYVVNLDDAGQYDQPFVDSLCRDTDIAVPVDVAQEASRRHVHLEHLRALGFRRPAPPPLPPVDLSLALGVNPFDGDRGDVGDRVLRDEIVVARVSHGCETPCHYIKKGERHRVMVEKTSGVLVSFRWCGKCTEAMAMGEPW